METPYDAEVSQLRFEGDLKDLKIGDVCHYVKLEDGSQYFVLPSGFKVPSLPELTKVRVYGFQIGPMMNMPEMTGYIVNNKNGRTYFTKSLEDRANLDKNYFGSKFFSFDAIEILELPK